MKRNAAGARRRGALALAACLLAAGCDYWKNLTDGKAADKSASLTVVALDLFKGDTLRVACADTAVGFTDSTGVGDSLFVSDPPTGRYRLHCRPTADTLYYESISNFDMVPGGSQKIVVRLARKGGDAWYPDLKPYIDIGSPLFRVPEPVTLTGFPIDSKDSLYRYEWSVRRRGDLTKTTKAPAYNVQLLRADSGEQDFVLKVWAAVPGREPYVIGSDSIQQAFFLNQTPVFTLGPGFNPDHAYKVSCDENALVLSYVASDPDGACNTVLFSSLSATSSLAKLDTALECFNDVEEVVSFPLIVPPQPDRLPGKVPDRLRIRVSDDNGEFTDTILNFKIAINKAPSLFKFDVESKKVQFTHRDVNIHFTVHDSDSPIANLRIKWENDTSKAVTVTPPNLLNELEYGVSHAYDAPGVYAVSASVTDACGSSLPFVRGPSVEVIDNRKPRLEVFNDGITGGTVAHLKLNASDRDMVDWQADSLTLSIDWKDASPPHDTDIACCHGVFGITASHDYKTPWTQPRPVSVTLTDAHDGVDTALIMIPAP